ncbi:MAG TPA: succinic semialdehyde dehydrogenase [Solirubrobacteraceae bacterium]|nr:succinic semialdehyde dehydrogenase [Solirubrobacteraceae bacterium]
MSTVEQQPDATASGARDAIPVQNPATGEVVRTVPVTAPEDVAGLVARARAAQPAWEALGFEGRGRVLRRAQKWLVDNADRVIDTIVSETGKTHEDARVNEVTYVAHAFGFWAKKAPEYLADEKVHSANPFILGRKLVVRYRPVGVVGIIGPWNYPLTNSFGDAVPALAAGNAVVLKPSEITPLTSMLMAECMEACGLPKDVYQVAPGYGETGAALIDHADMIMFTGSTRTGKKIMQRAAETLTPVSLELGGKDPMIVLADADLERAANAAVHYSMANAGQTCIAVERVYVEEPIYDTFVQKVADKVRGLRQGEPGGPGTTDVGAVTFPPQLDIINQHVEDAKAKGAKVLVGGHAKTDRGMYYEPTVLVDVDHTMDCMREETFGPTLPIMKVRDSDEALRLANDSQYGLAASIWTRDAAKGERLAREVEAGVVCVNDAFVNYLATELPMGGWKSSGLGYRHGAGGIRKFCRQQSLLVTRFSPTKKDLHMLPYKAGTTGLITRVTKLLYGRGKRD